MNATADNRTDSEITFWNRVKEWENLPFYTFEQRDADHFCGGRLMASTFEKVVFRSVTLTRKGGYAKGESIKAFGMVDGSKCSFWEASQTLAARKY